MIQVKTEVKLETPPGRVIHTVTISLSNIPFQLSEKEILTLAAAELEKLLLSK